MSAHLPIPAPEALAASGALSDLIRAEIRSSNGWIPFARYMEMVLYAPGLGYYSGGSAKLGKDGDFTTAPEITPLFGAAMAAVAEPILEQSAARILEFGAGSGKLARDLLSGLAARGVVVEQYAILDLSGELRARQQETLRDFPQVEWLDRMPQAFSGLVLGNEVLDAMPVQLVVKARNGWRERGVVEAETGFAFEDRPAGAEAVAQIPDVDALPEGYVTEVHPQAIAFMHTVGAMVQRGAAVFIDYGFPAHEYYHPQRRQGTLMCHYRHHAHPDPFYLPGLQDVTSHVDFSAIARAAQRAGLEPLCYASQAAFLIEAGIAGMLLRTDPSEARAYLPQANALQKLLSPAEMGELFKVMIAGRGVVLPDGYARIDRGYRL
ncbi:MAG TPA: SAM-dependent methyltransferase [Noviherbaspirillum sp.]|nr:SAM-dependent methyltransferase [Noviherbaspirillum sp.]